MNKTDLEQEVEISVGKIMKGYLQVSDFDASAQTAEKVENIFMCIAKACLDSYFF